MAAPFYRVILKQAWQVTSRHKTLWLFGFLGTFLGLGGEYQFLINQYFNFSNGGWQQVLSLADLFNYENLAAIVAVLSAIPGRALLALFLVLILLALFVWILITAQGALVRGAAEAIRGRAVRLGREFWLTSRSFWSLVGIMVSIRLVTFFLIAVIGLPLLAVFLSLDEAYVPAGAALLFFVLAMPVVILFSLVGRLAVAYHLIESKPWLTALSAGLSLFARHWLLCVELALILLPIGVLVAVIFVPLLSLLAAPFLVFGLAVADLSSLAAETFLVLALILFFLLLLLLGSALATWQSAVWTSLFLKIKDAPAQSKLVRILNHWREKYS